MPRKYYSNVKDLFRNHHERWIGVGGVFTLVEIMTDFVTQKYFISKSEQLIDISKS